jgi:predicted neuraminidase
MIAGLLLLASLLILTPQQRGTPTLKNQRVFGPEIPTGPYKHPAALTELENGDLYLVYYGGDAEYATDTGVFGARKKAGSPRWSRPQRIAKDPFRSLGNAVVWQAPDKVVWLFYVVRWGSTWSTSRIQAKISTDNAKTWSESFVLTEEEGTMVRGRPIVLSSGEYLLPVYHETGKDTEIVGADTTSRFLRFDPKRRLWEPSGAITSKKGNLQPAIAEISPGYVVAYCRRGGGYDAVTDGYIIRAESHDSGRTWTEGKDTPLPNPNAAVDLLKLQSGNLVLVYNDNMNERTPLTVALSTDGEKTWKFKRNISIAQIDHGYPYMIQARDGKIHIVYTTAKRTTIQHVVLDEAWIRAEK